MFYAVHFVLEFGPRGAHVGDHAADVTDDCSEYQDTAHEIEGNEEEFNIPHGAGDLSNGCQDQGRPVETVDVATEQRVTHSSLNY